jgi:hypothetical protein
MSARTFHLASFVPESAYRWSVIVRASACTRAVRALQGSVLRRGRRLTFRLVVGEFSIDGRAQIPAPIV